MQPQRTKQEDKSLSWLSFFLLLFEIHSLGFLEQSNLTPHQFILDLTSKQTLQQKKNYEEEKK